MNIFCASIDAVENADNTISEIKSQIDGMARAVFGEPCRTQIQIETSGLWAAYVHRGSNQEIVASARFEALLDTLCALKQRIDERRQKDALVAATLGLVTAEAAE